MGYFWGKIGIIGVLVRRLFFLCFFQLFWRVRASIRSRRRSRNAVFHFRGGLQKNTIFLRFLGPFQGHFWNKWLPNWIKNSSKLDLEHKNPKSSIFNDFGLLFWHPFGHTLRPQLLLGTLSVTLGGYSGLLFQPFRASSFQGNRCSIISLIWSRFWYNFWAFLMHFR